MLELDETHQLGIQMNLKDLGYTVVRGAIPPDMLKEIRNAFDRKMVTTKIVRHVTVAYAVGMGNKISHRSSTLPKSERKKEQ